ncbi:MAG: replicative DNA helicase [Candidatus Nomurabacteria bacterium]|jgi:replicative DNA helicase|nr:replicative DNA helicase [Candidatus Nomurabacteria bacterium]
MSNKSNLKMRPQNLEAEKSLLGALLISENSLPDVTEILTAADFYEKAHETIFASMVALYERHKPVDLLTVTNDLRAKKQLALANGASYLSDLMEYVPTAAHATAYADIVKKCAIRRRLIDASASINQLSYDENAEIDDLLGKAEAELYKISEKNSKSDLISLSDILEETFDRLEELHNNKGTLRGLKTGFRDLDNKTAGLQKSDLIIVGARPAMGKTTLVTNLMYNVANINKKGVLMFSLEMSKEQIIDRMLADASNVDSWNIRTGNLRDEDFMKISDAMSEMSEAPVWIDDTPGMNILQMRTKARRAVHDHDIGMIVIDYLQLMYGTNNANGNRVQELSEISRGLKLMAKELDLPVVALSQLSRSVEARSPQIPQLADLRESGSIEQDADIVMFIYREDYYNPETERQHITDLIIAKHRNGPTGKIELYFHPERLRFMSLDKKKD